MIKENQLLLSVLNELWKRYQTANFWSTKATTKSKFVQDCVKLAYGYDSNVVRESRFAGVPALSGTGACRLFAEFQRRFYPDSQMFLPMPTWSNHNDIWRDSEVCISTYHYYDPDTKGLQFQALMNDIKNASEHSFFLLHLVLIIQLASTPTMSSGKKSLTYSRSRIIFHFLIWLIKELLAATLRKMLLLFGYFLKTDIYWAVPSLFAKTLDYTDTE